tara:strand:- start:1656 stop:2510 length:855 start_codon:yes stop_codon:yes gene_type:complete
MSPKSDIENTNVENTDTVKDLETSEIEQLSKEKTEPVAQDDTGEDLKQASQKEETLSLIKRPAELANQDRVWLQNLVNKSNLGLKRVLIGTCATLFVSVGIFVLMLGEVSNRLGGVDVMLGGLTTRAIKLNSVLESFDEFNKTLVVLVEAQELLSKEQEDLSTVITALDQNAPKATQQAVVLGTSELAADFEALKGQVQSQVKGLKSLSRDVSQLRAQVKTFGVKVSDVVALSASVEALITLEKEQYLSVLERQAEIQASQSGQQLPKVPRDIDMIFFSDKASK